MFCNQCGAQVQPGYSVCPKCGQVIERPFAVPQESRLTRHLRTLGILWIVLGALLAVPAIVLVAVGSVAHFAIPGEEVVARTLGPLVLYLMGGVCVVLAAGGICVGWGLMQRRPWARVTAIVLGVLALFHPPLGTALGIYTLWVLLSNDAAVEYGRLGRAA